MGAFDGAAVGTFECATVGALDGTAVGTLELIAVGTFEGPLDIAAWICADASGSKSPSGSIARGVGVAIPEASGGLVALDAAPGVAAFEPDGRET